MSDSWPEADEVAALFHRLCGGNPVARSHFSVAVLDPLVSHLRMWRPDADEHACLTAAEDAVLALIHNPAIFDPAKCALIGFLCMSAKGDLLNALKKEARHHVNRESAESVELAADGGNTSADERADDLPSLDDPDLAAEVASFTAPERAAFDSDHRRAVIAAALTGGLGAAGAITSGVLGYLGWRRARMPSVSIAPTARGAAASLFGTF